MPTPLPTLPTPQVFDDFACTVCGCVCDDLKLTVQDGRIVRTEGACELAEPWLLAQDSSRPPDIGATGGASGTSSPESSATTWPSERIPKTVMPGTIAAS